MACLTVAAAATLLALGAAGCGSSTDQDGGQSNSVGAQGSSGREIGDGFAEVETVKYDPLVIPDDAPTVLFLGDSITAGLHLPSDQAFPAAVQRQAVAEKIPFHLVNAGVSGDTTRGALNRLPLLLKNSQPRVVVIELGANDGLRGQPLEGIKSNLRDMIHLSREAGAVVLLLQINVPTNLGDYAKDFSQLYIDLSVEEDVMVVPSFLKGVGGVPEMNLPDGLHPTPEGHEQLAKNITRPLWSLISDARPFKLK